VTPLYPHLPRLVSVYVSEHQPDNAPVSLAADELLFIAEALSLRGFHEEALKHCLSATKLESSTPLLAARAHTQLGWEYFNANRLSLALEHYAAAEDALRATPSGAQYDDARYYLYSNRGWLFRYLGRVEDGLTDYQAALAIAMARGRAHEQADASLGLGGVLEYQGDAAAAHAAYADAIRFADLAGDPWLQGTAKYMFGYFKINQGYRQEGITLCRESMATADRYGFSDMVEEQAWILAVGFALEGDLEEALRMAEKAVSHASPVLAAWDHLIRGIMRYRVADLRGARADFQKSLAEAEGAIREFESFDHLDTSAFAHAGMTLLGEQEHRQKAIAAYQRARAIAPAPGIRDFGLLVFSCFGSEPAVINLRDQLSSESAASN
jgi:tetratricopeptide (TPR) repeat protein